MQCLNIHIFILVLTFIINESSAQPPYTTLVAPLLKHTNKNSSVYSITLNDNEHYVIDLDAPFTWYVCNEMYPYPFACSSPQCLQARTYLSPLCPPSNSTSVPHQCWPCDDCDDGSLECESPCNRCAVTAVNPVAQTCEISQLTKKDLILFWTNGRNPTSGMNFNGVHVSCAPVSLLQSLPRNILGVAALSWSSLALTSEFFIDEVMAKDFAICLPGSSRARGVTFFGDGPYRFLPTNLDVKSLLSYTPLIRNPNSPGYYISVDGISVGGKALPISLGNRSVKLSTTVPYTTLRSDVYNHLIRRFSKGVKDIPRVPNPVNMFSLCLNSSAIGYNRIGLRVPRIDLRLGNGSTWSIYGPNSMQKFGSDVACLGFVDGGEKTEDAIVIGSFQMENNLLYFDLENSMLGFSSTLLLNRTSCGNFNFTAAPWMPPQPPS